MLYYKCKVLESTQNKTKRRLMIMRKNFCEYCGKKMDENGYSCYCRDNMFSEDEYNERLDIQQGWRQQDVIDMYRRER